MRAIVLFLSIQGMGTQAQNLVVNPGFESNSCIPNGFIVNPFDYNNCIINWQIPTEGTSDYHHSSSVNADNQVPANFFGSEPALTGNAYSGLFTYDFNCTDYREYIRATLTSALTIGTTYAVSMNISLGENSSYMTNNLGMLFTSVANPAAGLVCGSPNMGIISQPAGSQLINTATVQGNFNGWTLLSYTFTATAAHTYLFIGNFFNDAATAISFGPSLAIPGAYYYIDDISVTALQNPFLTSITATDIACYGNCTGSATANTVGGTSPYSYSWTGGQTAQTATGLCAGTYIVLVTDAAGNTNTSSVAIIQPNAISLSVISTPSDTGINNGTAAVNISGGTAGYAYLWNPGGQTTAIASNLSAGTYCCLVTDNNGCTDSACVNVDQKTTCGNIFVPNAFSPNNDLENDLECVMGTCIESLQIIIYNRWGNKVFESNDQKICWDGDYRGKNEGTAVFAYYLNVIFTNGKKEIRKGNINMIR